MAYEKRVCVLKQIKKGFTADGSALTGAVYAERMGTELTVTPRLTGIAPLSEGRYALAVWAGGKVLLFSLSGNAPMREADAPSLREGFAALLVYVRGEAEPVAFGRCGNSPLSHEPLLSVFAEAQKKKVPTPLPPTQLPGPAPNVPFAPGVPLPDPAEGDCFRERAQAYDDEAIASANYFREDGETSADESAPSPALQKEGENENGGETSAHEAPLLPRGSLTYYKEVREKLDTAFARYPADGRLKRAFPDSDWVDADGALLGILYEEGRPRYLCVAVPKEGDPPEEIRERCMFVPADGISGEEGFYVVFQDADTGDYVRVGDA